MNIVCANRAAQQADGSEKQTTDSSLAQSEALFDGLDVGLAAEWAHAGSGVSVARRRGGYTLRGDVCQIRPG